MASDIGKLEIEVHSGHKLRKVEKYFGTQDPYVTAVVEGNNIHARIATHFDSGSEPRWKENGLL
jgi:Ca2+-dependent lipid-binding protein